MHGELAGGSREGMAALVRTWADVVLTDVVIPLDDAILDAGSVLRRPADMDEIRSAERRLHFEFPASYRNFLLASDGAFADWQGATEAGRRILTAQEPFGLLPVAALSRLADTRPDILESWVGEGLPEPEHVDQRTEGCEVDHYEPLKTAILINRDRGIYYMCLAAVPHEFDADGEGAELWDAGHTGPIRYFTFESWLRAQLHASWFVMSEQRQQSGFQDPQPTPGGRLHLPWIRWLRWAPADTPFLHKLDTWASDENPYVRLAAAQGGLGHFPTIAVERLRELQRQDEPTVALAARTTLRLVGATPRSRTT